MRANNNVEQKILDFYKETSRFTYAGPYREYFRSLPEDISELGRLVCAQVIHRITLAQGNTNANADLRYGDMDRYPEYRMRCEDDVFLTAVSMAAELFRMDERGFVGDRAVEHKLVMCCRYVSVLMTSILKAKGYAARCRAGYAPYISDGDSFDHWITQYYDENEGRWVTIDADGFFDEEEMGFDQYDIPEEKFDWAASTWLAIRRSEVDGSRFVYADGLGTNSLKALLLYLFYDLNALMNQELTFSFVPWMWLHFDELTEDDFVKLDEIAKLMVNADENHDLLYNMWKDDKKLRMFCSPLVGESDIWG